MGKIFDSINGSIMSAMKEKNNEKANAYKNLKAKMLEFKTAKNAKPLDDAAEINIIKNMVTELYNDAELFANNNRNDLAEPAKIEAVYLEAFLPKEASEEEIKVVIEEYLTPDMTMKDMGNLIKTVKSNFENVDGKLVANLVKTYLNSK